LHWIKGIQRGYNQAFLLAQKLPVRTDLLERSAYTFSQTGLSKEERNKNVQNAFTVVEDNREEIKGGKFILVDDVCTTGSTLRACCACLKRGGANTVWGITFARD
jgi:ComF family protein